MHIQTTTAAVSTASASVSYKLRTDSKYINNKHQLLHNPKETEYTKIQKCNTDEQIDNLLTEREKHVLKHSLALIQPSTQKRKADRGKIDCSQQMWSYEDYKKQKKNKNSKSKNKKPSKRKRKSDTPKRKRKTSTLRRSNLVTPTISRAQYLNLTSKSRSCGVSDKERKLICEYESHNRRVRRKPETI